VKDWVVLLSTREFNSPQKAVYATLDQNFENLKKTQNLQPKNFELEF